MANPVDEPLLPKIRGPLGWTFLFLLLVAGIFNYPILPSTDLDGSWRMDMGYFFQHNFQHGLDVVFTYGPLGFEMAKTYSGLQFAAIVVTQLGVAIFGAALVIREGRRLHGLPRWAFFVAFILFGVTYEDALQMLVIALAGFQLLRLENRWPSAVIISLALAVMSTIKFTNLMVAGLAVGAVVVHALWTGRHRKALIIGGTFAVGFLAAWIACGQNPVNLPVYLRTSWAISQGYNDDMGLRTPWPPLWKALVVLGVLGSYLLLHLRINPDKPRALANAVLLSSFIFVNWKHGFVRSDGHMIGFFFCALLPLTAYPSLLDDPPRLRLLHFALFAVAAIVAVSGIESALYHTARTCFGIVENKIWSNIERALDPAQTQLVYHDRLIQARETVSVPQIRKEVGTASIDVMGHEQAVALFNDFNYRPRPIFQSYSVFNPYLENLNRAYYSSDHAPDFVLVKVQAIDSRMAMMDDSAVWRILPHRYDFVTTEKGFQLWRKLPGPFVPATAEPTPLLTTTLAVDQPLPLDAYAGKQLWIKIGLPRTLLGRLHAFLYKPPHVTLAVTDDQKRITEYYLPLALGEAGFLISPIVEDTVAFASYASGRTGLEARSLSLKIKPGDRMLFGDEATIELSELKPAGTGNGFFAKALEEKFHMFKTFPLQYEAHVSVSENTVDGMQMVVLHAPSEMTFNLPDGAVQVSGFLGFVPGAYSDGGDTNGAEFVVVWSNGHDTKELYRRFLDPVHKPVDRGMQPFTVALSAVAGGRIYLRVEPGPFGNFAWDWTGWSGIEIK